MSAPNDGGQKQEPQFLYHASLELRDYFAAAALTGLCANSDFVGPDSKFAEGAYAFADAMLAERSKT